MVKVSKSKRKEIEKLLTQITCDKDFGCVRNNFIDLCKVEYNSEHDLLMCFEEKHCKCKFKDVTNQGIICRCPLRKIAYSILL